MIYVAKIIPLTLLVFGSLIIGASADMVYLNNGRSIEGFLVNEDEQGIDLEVGFGTIKIEKNQIIKIDKSNSEESKAIYQKWEKDKSKSNKREEMARQRKEQQPEDVGGVEEKYETVQKEIKKDSNPHYIDIDPKYRHIVVDAFLNKKVHASLMLDTGASIVMLSKAIGQRLGVDLNIDPDDKAGIVTMTVADGRKVQAKFVRLESIKVESAEVENVAAAVLLEDAEGSGFYDGLLGMSFLKKFNFKVDRENNRLILEPIE